MITDQAADPISIATDFARTLEEQMSGQLFGAKLTLTRYATLVRADGRTVADIAPLLGVSPQMVSRTVKDLTLLGYLRGVPGTDARTRVLQVTDEGRAALAHVGDLSMSPALLSAMESYVNQHHPDGSRPASR